MLAEVKDEIEDGFVLIVLVCLRSADLDEVDDVVVLEELQNSDLAKRCDWELEVETRMLGIVMKSTFQ